MAANTSLVTQLSGQAWVRGTDGTLNPIQQGMRIPANADVVTAAGASVQLQADGQPPLTINENRDVQLGAEVAQPDVDPSTAAAAMPADPDVARVIEALEAGNDPLQDLDPTAAVIEGGAAGDGGSSFTRLAAVLELTTPLGLEYPRPTFPRPEEIRLGGVGSNRAPELTGSALLGAGLLDQTNDDSDLISGLNVGQYFTDPDGNPLSFTASNLPPGLSINPVTGIIEGTLDSSASQGGLTGNGIYNVIITATDPYGASINLPFTWTTLNPPPVAADDVNTTEENTVVVGNVLEGDPITGTGRDVDPDGDKLTVIEITNSNGDKVPAGSPITGVNEIDSKGGGSFTINPDGSYTFDPGTDFDYLAVGETTTTTVTYQISDGDGGFDDATLTITVTGTNDAPVIVPNLGGGLDDAATVTEVKDLHEDENIITHEKTGVITFEDADDSDTHTITTQPAPVAGQPPFLGGLVAVLNDDITISWTFTVDDKDIDYLAAGETLEQKYTIKISDSHGGTVEQNVTITIVGMNDAPIINAAVSDTTGAVTEDAAEPTTSGTLVWDDADTRDDHTWVAKDDGQGSYGKLAINDDGEWVYTLDNSQGSPADRLPAGEIVTDTITVIVDDGNGGTDIQDIVITITGSNDVPVLSTEHDDYKAEGTVKESGYEEPGTLTTSGQLIATDIDTGDTLAWSFDATDATVPTLTLEGIYGSITLDPVTGVWVYTLNDSAEITEKLNLGQNPEEKFDAYVSDGKGGIVKQEIAVTVQGTNDAPVAVADTDNVSESGVLKEGQNPNAEFKGKLEATGNVLANDTDIDSAHANLKVSEVSFNDAGTPTAGIVGSALNGKYGSLQLNEDGSYTYTLHDQSGVVQSLKQGQTENETFTYTVVDEHGAKHETTLTITVAGTNDQPTITTAVGGNQGSVIEQGVGSENATPKVEGTLTADDVDADHVLTWGLQAKTDQTVEPANDGGTKINGTYGWLTLGKDGQWTYELDNTRAATQALKDGEDPKETFTARVTDEHGAYAEQVITITVNGTNDAPVAKDDSVSFKEDLPKPADPNQKSSTGNVLDNDINPDDGGGRTTLKVTTFKIDGDDTEYPADGNTVDIGGIGTFSINENGTYVFTPKEHYSGKVPEITYTIQEPSIGGEAGLTDSATLNFDITPVADAPSLGDPKDVETLEDNSIALGLKAPEVTDKIDHNGTGEGDNPELLGLITLSGIPEGVQLLNDAGGVLWTSTGENSLVTIDLTNGHENGNGHIAGSTGDLTMTKEQFESLKVNPKAHDGNNFTVKISVDSYEVDNAGTPLPDIHPANTTVDVIVDVQAVTDDVALTFKDDSKVASFTMNEDSKFDLTSQLKAAFEDLDGSEQRDIVISGLPAGSKVFVDGISITVGAGGHFTISAKDVQTGGIDSFPKIQISPPANFSGDIEGIKVTLKAMDTDKDSNHNIAAKSDEVTLDLHVKPIAGDVSVGGVTGLEDSAIKFLANIKLTDRDGSEKITGFVIKGVPEGWVVKDAADNVVDPDANGNYPLNPNNLGTTGAGQLAYYKDWTVTPPAHSSSDAIFKVDVTTVDTQIVNGTEVTHTNTKTNVSLKVTVKPVAEKVGVDTDGDGTPDLTMTGGHTYNHNIPAGEDKIAGKEDKWFAINQDGFDLQAGWSNQDGKQPDGTPNADSKDGGTEETFAVLTPVIASGALGDFAAGSQFRYKDPSKVTTENPDGYVVLTFNGKDGVEIPMEFLGSVEFLPSLNVSGTFNIKVQAKTVDTDANGNFTDTAISGEAWLNGIIIAPVADPVTLGVGSAHGKEDTEIPLVIRPTSADSSETFNVKISDIPEGAVLTYGTTVYTPVNGVVTIDGFDSNISLTVKPPHNSNEDFTLKVEAQSVDAAPGQTTDVSDWTTQDIKVTVKGVADDAEITFETDVTFTEAELDSGDTTITLADIVASATLQDTDGSEALTFKITGLLDGFMVEGATFIGGTGAGREWVFTQAQMKDITIKVPEHYSGKLPGTLTAITTENDGDSKTGVAQEWDVTITPSPESILIASSTFNEDERGALDFAIGNNFGDTNEELTAVWIKVFDGAREDLTLYLDGKEIATAGLATEKIDGVDYYVLHGDNIGKVSAQAKPNAADNDPSSPKLSVDVKYEITDHSNHGDVAATVVVKDIKHELNVTPVTDPVDLVLNGNGAKDLVSRGEFSVGITLSKPATEDASGQSDYDGSEKFTQLVIGGVPDGMLVTGLKIGGTTLSNISFLGNGKWLISIPEADYARFNGKIDANILFKAGSLLGNDKHNLTVTVVTQDTGASNVAVDSEGLTISTDFTGGGSGELPVVDITFGKNEGFTGTEDQSFTLDQAFTGTVNQSDTNFTLTLRLPAGATVNQDGTDLSPTSLDGEDVWVINGKGDLDAFLVGITVTPPADLNDNKGGMEVDATLTGYLDNGSQSQGDVTTSLPLTPVTDAPYVDITFWAADDNGTPTGETAREGNDVGITLTAGNKVDIGSGFGDAIYVQLTEEAVGGLAGGTLTYPDGTVLETITVADGNEFGLPAGTYYKAKLPEGQDSVDLKYTPAAGQEFKAGDITIDAWVQSQESGAANKVTAGSGESGTREGINNGYDLTVGTDINGTWVVTGDENQDGTGNGIALGIGGTGLLDNDGSESVLAAMLKGLPNGFLVYVDGELASNAGADGDNNNWLIPVKDGVLPKISVVPPQNWSGTLEDVELSVLSGEKGQETWGSSAEFNLVVNAKADGILSFNPAPAFSTADGIVHLNLNLTMKDGVLVESGDQSFETVTLTLKGLGQHALFFVGKDLHSGDVAYDATTGTYTLTGLTQTQVDNLGFVQTADMVANKVHVTAQTVESVGGDKSAEVSDDFDLSIVNQGSMIGTDGDDIIVGKGGNDVLKGGEGNDIIYGGEGKDTLIGGKGDDILIGGKGDDIFKWEEGDQGTVAAPAKDIIKDFGNGDDTLDLSELLVGEDAQGADLSKFLNFTQDGNNTVINVNTTGGLDADGKNADQQITLENVKLDGLMTGSDDFSTLTQNDMINNLIASGKLNVDQ